MLPSWSLFLANPSCLLLFLPWLTLPCKRAIRIPRIHSCIRRRCWSHYRGPVLRSEEAMVDKSSSHKKHRLSFPSSCLHLYRQVPINPGRPSSCTTVCSLSCLFFLSGPQASSHTFIILSCDSLFGFLVSVLLPIRIHNAQRWEALFLIDYSIIFRWSKSKKEALTQKLMETGTLTDALLLPF